MFITRLFGRKRPSVVRKYASLAGNPTCCTVPASSTMRELNEEEVKQVSAGPGAGRLASSPAPVPLLELVLKHLVRTPSF